MPQCFADPKNDNNNNQCSAYTILNNQCSKKSIAITQGRYCKIHKNYEIQYPCILRNKLKLYVEKLTSLTEFIITTSDENKQAWIEGLDSFMVELEPYEEATE